MSVHTAASRIGPSADVASFLFLTPLRMICVRGLFHVPMLPSTVEPGTREQPLQPPLPEQPGDVVALPLADGDRLTEGVLAGVVRAGQRIRARRQRHPRRAHVPAEPGAVGADEQLTLGCRRDAGAHVAHRGHRGVERAELAGLVVGGARHGTAPAQRRVVGAAVGRPPSCRCGTGGRSGPAATGRRRRLRRRRRPCGATRPWTPAR